MNEIQIRCFLESAEQKSFSRAAKALYISQPTVSRNIGELEREWGFRIFDRKGGIVILTEAGEKMADFFKKELRNYDRTIEEIRRSLGGGELCIALLNGQMINSILREAILKMKAKYPDVRIGMQRYDYNEIRDQLALKNVDIAELPRDAVSFRCSSARTYCQYETFLVIPENSPYAYRKNLEMKYFLKQTLISVEKTASVPDRYEELWKEKCRQYHLEPRIIHASDIKQQEMMVELGEGVAICNINHMMTNSPHTKFVRLKELTPAPFELIWNEENRNPALEKFLSCVDFRPDEII